MSIQTPEQVLQQALSRAFSLGQTYWRQADSESYKQNKLADGTHATYTQLVTDTVAALSLPAAAVPTQQPDREELLGDAIRALIRGDIKCSDDLPPEKRPVHVSARRAFGAVYDLLLARALAPTGGEAEQLQTDLHAAIMNLPCNPPPGERIWTSCYKQGHRDARHAAAELAQFHLAAPKTVRTSGEALGTVPSAQGWISVDERMPDREERVLVYGAKRLKWAVAEWDERDGWQTETSSEFYSMYPPTHWMPLPPAPGALGAASPEVLPASPVPNEQDPSRVSASPTDGGNQ